jgi:hypothetical protein
MVSLAEVEVQRESIILSAIRLVKSVRNAAVSENPLTQDLVVVFTSAGPGYADIIKSTLEAAGIPATTSREGAGAAYGFTVGALGLVDVLVTADRAEEARALLAELPRDDQEAGSFQEDDEFADDEPD